MGWTPAIGARSLARRMGKPAAMQIVVRILGDESGPHLLLPPYRTALIDIGNGHAEQLMGDDSGKRLAYWPKVWAARALAYMGDLSARGSLVAALSDDHWRVRTTAVQTIGRIGIRDATGPLVAALDDDHPRVRSAAVLALERVGDETALGRLSGLLGSDSSSRRAEQAISRILDRR